MEINKIYKSDCLDFLRSIDDNSVNVIVTSPPYNKGYWSRNRNMNNGFHTKSRRIEYTDFDDCMNPEDYIKWQKDVLSECIRILKDDGSIFYNHIDILREHQTIHPLFVYDFPVKQIIVWNRQNTPKLDKSYFLPITEYIFWIQKTKTSRVKYDRNKAIFKTNIWDISYDRENAHPAPFPLSLALNCITPCVDEGDLVLDPFMGSGTTALAAVKNKCNYIGCDTSDEYISYAEKRIEKETSQLSLF